MSPPKVTLAKPTKFSDDDVFIGDTSAPTNQITSESQRNSKTSEDAPKITIDPVETTIVASSQKLEANNEVLSINSSEDKEKRKSRTFSEAVKYRFRSRSTERKREKTSSLRSTSSAQAHQMYLSPPTNSNTPSPTPSKKRSRSLSSSIRRIFTANKPKIERRGSGHIVIPVRESSLPKDAASYSSVKGEQRTLDEDIQKQRHHLQMTSGSASPEIIMSTSAPQHNQLLY